MWGEKRGLNPRQPESQSNVASQLTHKASLRVELKVLSQLESRPKLQFHTTVRIITFEMQLVYESVRKNP